MIGGALFTAAVKADLVFLIVDCSCCTLGESLRGGLLSARLQAQDSRHGSVQDMAIGYRSAQGQRSCWALSSLTCQHGALTNKYTSCRIFGDCMQKCAAGAQLLVLTHMLHANLVDGAARSQLT